MNFFEHQDRARRKTKQLIILLLLAVISLVVITTLAVAALLYFSGHGNATAYASQGSVWTGILHTLNLETFCWIALIITSVVVLGSLFRFMQLSAGGRAIAEAMGGRLLVGQTSDPDERKILNVVEEMAIASGTAVPPVYLLEDTAINAFAAGYHPQDAVIGITRGCITQLSRDELQGVIAHEFSHIFHGDMRLNMRLVALLYGILVIGLLGEFIMRAQRTQRLVANDRDKSAGGILILGAVFFVIGYTGTFFGNLIKAAVSRQREFLADASAVQFTRNPNGIAGALKKIGASHQGSQLHHDQAAEFSHMYFSQGVRHFLNMMATHPPLEQRIKRIQPNWNGTFEPLVPAGSSAGAPLSDSVAGFAPASGSARETSSAANIEDTLQRIAQPTAAQLAYAQACLSDIPTELHEASHDPFSARGIVFGLLLAPEENLCKIQRDRLDEALLPGEMQSLNPIMYTAYAAPVRLRLPLLELSLSAIKQLSDTQYQRFLHCLNLLIHADRQVSTMEWAIYRIVIHNTRPQTQPLRTRQLIDAREDCELLLSLVAYTGAADQTAAEHALQQASSALPFPRLQLRERSSLSLDRMDGVVERLNQLHPLQKPQLLKAMHLCVMHDGHLSVDEAELFRALADSLDCPIPPLLHTIPMRQNQAHQNR